MSRADYYPVETIQNFRSKQPQIILEGLQIVIVLVRPITVTEHFPKGLMFVGQFLDSIIIGVEPQAEHPQHQNLPLGHTGAAGIRVGLDGLSLDLTLGQHLCQYGKYRLSQLRRDEYMLQAAQNLWDIVA
jgi:hypothetical protein